MHLLLPLALLSLVFGGCADGPPAPLVCPRGESAFEGRCQPAGLPEMQCAPGEIALADGGCQAAGLPPNMACPPGEADRPGAGCAPAGIPPKECAQGFKSEGKGECNAILPTEDCPDGMMAIPGDTQCHEVAPCGTEKWGDIPVDAQTVFVDGSYTLSDSNGSEAKPWKHIQSAVNAAPSGGTIAIAAGTYTGAIRVEGKSLKLRGRCPSMVEIDGIGSELAAVTFFGSAATESTLSGVSITGPVRGVILSGAGTITLSHVRIHDTGDIGIDVQPGSEGLTQLGVSSSLLERTKKIGVFSWGSSVSIDKSEVRETQIDATGQWGIGVDAEPFEALDADVTVSGSLIAKNHHTGVMAASASATIQSTVVRETAPDESGEFMSGMGIMAFGQAKPAHLAVRGSIIEKNTTIGVLVDGATARIEATAVRDTQAPPAGFGGWGIAAQANKTAGRADLTVIASTVVRNLIAGIYVAGANALIEGTLVRDTLPIADQWSGQGISALVEPETAERANVTVRGSLVEKNHGAGLVTEGADLRVEASVVRETAPQAQGDDMIGVGIGAMDDVSGNRANLTVQSSIIEKNDYSNISITGADARIESSVVREAAREGLFVTHSPKTAERGNVTVIGSLIEKNRHSGVDVWASDAQIEASVVRETLENGEGYGTWGIRVRNVRGTGNRANATIRSSVIEKNAWGGLAVTGSSAVVEATVVRDTFLDEAGLAGVGLMVTLDRDSGEQGHLTARASLVENNHSVGIMAYGGDALIEGTLVRETQPDGEAKGGYGIDASYYGARSKLTLLHSIIEKSHDFGVFIAASDARIEGSVVRETVPITDYHGNCVQVQGSRDMAERAKLDMKDSLVEDCSTAGIIVTSSDAAIESTTVRKSRANSKGQMGDGIVVISDEEATEQWGSPPSSVTITRSHFEGNERAGIANWGALVRVTSSTFTCHKIDLNGEDLSGYPWSFDGSKDNHCGCPEPKGSCSAKSGEFEQPSVDTGSSALPPPP